MFELVFLSGVRAGAVVPVESSMSAGRSNECALEVPDPNSSRFHATFEFNGYALTLADNNASNGTYVNEIRIKRQILQHGDIVRIGETRIRVQQRKIVRREIESGKGSSIFLKEDKQDGESIDGSLQLSLDTAGKPSLDAGHSSEFMGLRLQAVQLVAEALASANRQDVFHIVLDTLFKVFVQAERGHLLIGSTFEDLQAKASLYRNAKRTGQTLEISASLCKTAFEKKAVFVWNDKGRGLEESMSLVSLAIRSAMVVPLVVHDEMLGLLIIDTKDPRRPFKNEDMELGATVGRLVAFFLKNALLVEKAEVEIANRRNLMRFLPKPVAEQALNGQLDLALGGKIYRGTVFFSDVIGFTRLAEHLDPAIVVEFMNEYFNAMVPCIEEEEGAIDKFMGDAIMAFWGIPFDSGGACHKAVKAGIRLQTVLTGFNSLMHSRGLPSLATGIGMDSGQVVAGNVGSADRLEYTVLGNVVNTAYRIQGLAGRSQILISQTTLQGVRQAVYGVTLPVVSVKNKTEQVTVISMRGIEVDGHELLLHIPILIAGQQAVIIRRLSSGEFVLLHPENVDADRVEIVANMQELPNAPLGRLSLINRLPNQKVDGVLRRSVVQLEDPTLGGLLGPKLIPSPKQWSEMDRRM
jgi:class 3 adenylate cyclase